jgi:hypothetical protein
MSTQEGNPKQSKRKLNLFGKSQQKQSKEEKMNTLLVTQFVAQAYYDWIVRFKNASNLCPT